MLTAIASRLMPSHRASQKAVPVEVRNLHKSFGDHEVLHDISISVEPGEIFVIMGPSGSGKSVLLKCIAGLEDPTGGDVHVADLDSRDPAMREEVKMALVFQAGALFNSMSVFDNLALYPREHRLYDHKAIQEKVMGALRILGLEKAAGKFPSELSGGMKKRVAIARALVMEPQLLLYDEPTSELDPTMSATITEIIATLRDEMGVTSIVVSHDRDLSLTIADRVAILMEGKMIALDTPERVRQSNERAVKEFLNPVIDLKNPRFKQNNTTS
jgi:phospholipid/cholesterol/gamma-HCH transport system ATP-binding protein